MSNVAIRFSDLQLKITLRDQEGELMDLDELDAIGIFLFQEGKPFFEKYSRADAVGWEAITINSPSSGEMFIEVATDTWTDVVQDKDLLGEVVCIKNGKRIPSVKFVIAMVSQPASESIEIPNG